MEINPLQILFQIINFSVVVGALGYFAYKPIKQVLDKRREKVAEAQHMVETVEKKKQRLEREGEELVAEARQRADELVAKAKKESEERRQQLLSEAREKAQRELEQARKYWKQEKHSLVQELEEELAAVVAEVSRKFVGQKITAQQDRKLIDQNLDKIINQL